MRIFHVSKVLFCLSNVCISLYGECLCIWDIYIWVLSHMKWRTKSNKNAKCHETSTHQENRNSHHICHQMLFLLLDRTEKSNNEMLFSKKSIGCISPTSKIEAFCKIWAKICRLLHSFLAGFCGRHYISPKRTNRNKSDSLYDWTVSFEVRFGTEVQRLKPRVVAEFLDNKPTC